MKKLLILEFYGELLFKINYTASKLNIIIFKLYTLKYKVKDTVSIQLNIISEHLSYKQEPLRGLYTVS